MHIIISLIILLGQPVLPQSAAQTSQDSAMKNAKSIHREQYEYYKQLQRAPEITVEDFHFALKNPNPANTESTIAYQLPMNSMIELNIYDLFGRKIKTFASGKITEGEHLATWDHINAENKVVESGIYLVKFNATIDANKRHFQKTLKLLILKE